jgi:hypothetical protein
MKATAICLMLALLLTSHLAAGVRSDYGASTDTSRVNGHVKMALHVRQHAKGCSGVTLGGFDDIVWSLPTWSTDPSTGGIDVFLVVFDYDSLSGIEYGLSWPPEWGSASTRSCIPDPVSAGTIIEPGDGMTLLWETGCKIPLGWPGGNTAPFLLAACTWLMPTGPGWIRVTENPASMSDGVFDCGSPDYRGYEYVSDCYCAAVGIESPGCNVSPTNLDFGIVAVGDSADRTFTITNTSPHAIYDGVWTSCTDYRIIGDPDYLLGWDEHKEFTVRYSPRAPGSRACEIHTGWRCESVMCTGVDVSTEPTTWGAIKAIYK